METEPDLASVAAAFERVGGVFVTPPAVIAERLQACRAIVLDWDGVFNPGDKSAVRGSGFSEPDSMGLNMARYGLWRRDGCLPVVAILSGEHNATARELAEREHFDALYLGLLDKAAALRHLVRVHGVGPDRTAVVFDDVNDLSVAARCGVRFLVGRTGSPLFTRYAVDRGVVDYVTGNGPTGHAVREVAELVLGCLGTYHATIHSRATLEGPYRDYLAARRQTATARYREDAGEIVALP